MLTSQQISVDDLDQILDKFDLGEIKEIKPLVTSGNIAYLIKTKQQLYLLRLCPNGPRWRSKEEILAELEFINYLHRHNFPVFSAIKDKNGNEVISQKNHNGYLREFIAAQEKLNPSVEEVVKFGEMLGWLHSLIENYQTRSKRKHIFGLNETKQYFKEKKEKILQSNFKNKEKFVTKFESEIKALNFPNNLPMGMIHEDLGKRHVLWQGNKIVGIIDFDRCYYGKLILDLGQAIRGWCFENDWQRWSNKNFMALINGYQKRRQLTNLENKHLTQVIKFGILERALSFCLRFIEVTQDKGDEEFALDSVFRQLDLVPK